MIRKAVQNDIDAVERIYLNIHKCEEEGLTSTGWLSGIYPVRGTAEAALKRDDLFVYEKDGKILACGVINRIQGEQYYGSKWKYPADESRVLVLHTLCVEPNERGKGIGTAFAEYYEKLGRESGCTVLRIDTNEKNIQARSFYKKLGFREAGTVSCVFKGIPDVNLVMLEKSLEADYCGKN